MSAGVTVQCTVKGLIQRPMDENSAESAASLVCSVHAHKACVTAASPLARQLSLAASRAPRVTALAAAAAHQPRRCTRPPHERATCRPPLAATAEKNKKKTRNTFAAFPGIKNSPPDSLCFYYYYYYYYYYYSDFW